MKVLLRFARVAPNNRVVLVELWGEEDGTLRNLRKTTLNPTDNVEKFRQDFGIEDMKSFVKAIKDEIQILENYEALGKALKKII